jgi:hypothetical protein
VPKQTAPGAVASEGLSPGWQRSARGREDEQSASPCNILAPSSTACPALRTGFSRPWPAGPRLTSGLRGQKSGRSISPSRAFRTSWPLTSGHSAPKITPRESPQGAYNPFTPQKEVGESRWQGRRGTGPEIVVQTSPTSSYPFSSFRVPPKRHGGLTRSWVGTDWLALPLLQGGVKPL